MPPTPPMLFSTPEGSAGKETTPLNSTTGDDRELSEVEQAARSADPPPPPMIDDDDWWDEPAPAADTAPPADAAPAADTAPPATDAPPATEPPRRQTAPLNTVELDSTRTLPGAGQPQLAAQHSQRGLAAGALRDVGRMRLVNQDSVFAMLTTVPRESSDLTIGLFVVADGMGGHASGEIASRMAVSSVARQIMADLIVPALDDGATEALQPLLIAAVQEANREIYTQAVAAGIDMGTTCTTALLLGHAVYVGHIGDSRAYLHSPTGLRCITTDHSSVGRLIQLGQLDPIEAREHPLRSQLYRTVGQTPEVQVDFYYHQLGDATHLLLCSDGLWGMIDDEVIADVLDHNLWPDDACRELIARANLAGGEDNIAAVVVTLPSIHQ